MDMNELARYRDESMRADYIEAMRDAHGALVLKLAHDYNVPFAHALLIAREADVQRILGDENER